MIPSSAMKRAIVVGPLLLVLACSEASSPIAPDPPPSLPPPPPPSFAEAVLVGAGDIGDCGSNGPALTAALLDRTPGTVFTAGDNAYPSGSGADFQNCYHPTWGRHRDRTRPTPGNHDYETPRAEPYYAYFGANAGPFGLGYYSYNLEAWHVVSLNSSAAADSGSSQMRWLVADLADNPTPCTLAYFHHSVISSGRHGNQSHMLPIWRALYESGVDVVISAHDHNYERFAPQDAQGRSDPQRGIREFVVGTGGAPLTQFGQIRQNSEVRGSAWGVLKLTLRPGGYDWDFLPAASGSLTDSGSGACH